jgi:hypothetical protein
MQEEQAREIAREAAEMGGAWRSFTASVFRGRAEELREYRRDFLFIRSQRRTSEAIGLHIGESRSVSS